MPLQQCDECGQEIDPEYCHCGDSAEYHGRAAEAGHPFVPMGCECYRAKPPEPPMPAREPTHDWLK